MAVMQDLAADQLTDDSDPRLGVRGASPRQHVPPAIFFWEVLAFTVFLCFSCFNEQELHLQSAEIMYNWVQLGTYHS